MDIFAPTLLNFSLLFHQPFTVERSWCQARLALVFYSFSLQQQFAFVVHFLRSRFTLAFDVVFLLGEFLI
jgi:hypothetical protein